MSPRQGEERSTLVLFSHRDPPRNQLIHAALRDAGFDIALRNDKLRIAPHLYNSGNDIDTVVALLAKAGR